MRSNLVSITDTKLLTSRAVMGLFNLDPDSSSDRSVFWAAVRTQGLPFIKFTRRRYYFDEDAVRAWLASRTIGAVAGPQ